MEVLYLVANTATQFKALEILKYPDILISYGSLFHDRIPKWTDNIFVDSGGYGTILQYGKYITSDVEYLVFIEKVKPKYFALRDYACDRNILRKWNRTAKQHIRMTVEHHLRMLDLIDKFNIESEPVPVIQGSKLEEFLECLDLFKEYDLLKFELIGLSGSISKDLSLEEARKVIKTLRKEIPKNRKLHLFGIRLNLMKDLTIFKSIYSADTVNWDYRSRWKKLDKYKDLDSRVEKSVMYAKEYIKVFENMKIRSRKVKTIYDVL